MPVNQAFITEDPIENGEVTWGYAYTGGSLIASCYGHTPMASFGFIIQEDVRFEWTAQYYVRTYDPVTQTWSGWGSSQVSVHTVSAGTSELLHSESMNWGENSDFTLNVNVDTTINFHSKWIAAIGLNPATNWQDWGAVDGNTQYRLDSVDVRFLAQSWIKHNSGGSIITDLSSGVQYTDYYHLFRPSNVAPSS